MLTHFEDAGMSGAWHAVCLDGLSLIDANVLSHRLCSLEFLAWSAAFGASRSAGHESGAAGIVTGVDLLDS